MQPAYNFKLHQLLNLYAKLSMVWFEIKNMLYLRFFLENQRTKLFLIITIMFCFAIPTINLNWILIRLIAYSFYKYNLYQS